MATKIESYTIFGFKITPVTFTELLEIVSENIRTDRKVVIASQNLHGVYMSLRDPKVRNLQARSIVHIDGMPIVWLAKLAGLKLQAKHRTDWISWFLPLLDRAAERGWRVFYLGCDAETLSKGLEFIEARNPTLKITGHHGYFDADPESAANAEIIKVINEFGTNLLIVGMGMGRQEHWISDNLDRLDVNCIGTAGACIEYFAGKAPMAPRWMGGMGIEWLYRLLSNPRRFWWRYLVEPWITAWLIVQQCLKHRAKSPTQISEM